MSACATLTAPHAQRRHSRHKKCVRQKPQQIIRLNTNSFLVTVKLARRTCFCCFDQAFNPPNVRSLTQFLLLSTLCRDPICAHRSFLGFTVRGRIHQRQHECHCRHMMARSLTLSYSVEQNAFVISNDSHQKGVINERQKVCERVGGYCGSAGFRDILGVGQCGLSALVDIMYRRSGGNLRKLPAAGVVRLRPIYWRM